MSDRKSKIEIAGYKGKKLHPVLKLLLVLALAGTAVFSILLGLVLGGAHDSIDGSPRVMIILGCQLHDWGPSIMLQDRLDKALEYLEDHPDMTVVASGGRGRTSPPLRPRGWPTIWRTTALPGKISFWRRSPTTPTKILSTPPSIWRRPASTPPCPGPPSISWSSLPPFSRFG